MEDPVIGIMSDKAKEWFARAVVGMIWADGRIDQAEIDYLKGILSFLKDKELVHSVLAMIKQNKVPALEPIQLDQEQALAVLKHLTSISIVDEDFAKAEEEFLKTVAKLLGLPSDIAEKFIIFARKRLGGSRYHCNLLIGDDSLDVVGFGFSETECLFFSDRRVNPLARLTLMVYKDQKDKNKSEFYSPFIAEAQWCRSIKSGMAKFVVKALFKKRLTVAEGARMVLSLPDDTTRKTFQPKFNSLLGYYVQCRVCGEKNIPFWQLRTRSLHADNNIFGIPCYDRAIGEKEFCDYNLFQVSVCPNCLFASNKIDFFQRQDKAIGATLFDQKTFRSKWQSAASQLRKLVTGNDSWLYALERDREQAIISYQLAIATHKQLEAISDDMEQADHQRKVISFMLTQAEMLMDKAEKTEAGKLVKKAKTLLENAFPNLEREAAIRAAHLIIMINIYFKKYDDIGEYMNFLQKYDRFHTVTPGSNEAKSLNRALEITRDAWQSRNEYAFDRTNGFHLRAP